MKFKIFESYLNGNRQPLIHQTNKYNLISILNTDELKISKATDDQMSISFTRSLYYSEASTSARLLLDVDKLMRDGYKIIPYDELYHFFMKLKNNVKNKVKDIERMKKIIQKFKKYSKVNPHTGLKYMKHNVNLVSDENQLEHQLEHEYEERIYKNIKKLGKYIIAIDIDYSLYYDYELNIMKNYLKKYPHIEIFEYNQDNLWDRRKKIDINI
jgi:hypothetical protein